MAGLTRPRRSGLILCLMMLAFASCGGPSAISKTGGPSNTNANNSGPASSGIARLDRFVGSWGGYAGKSIAVSHKVGIDSGWMKVVGKQVSPGTLELEGDVWQAKATLKYDPSSEKYLLSFAAEGFPPVADVPMAFSEADGFSGARSFTYKEKEAKAEATIKDVKGESEWHMSITQGKDMWNLTIRLGKEQ